MNLPIILRSVFGLLVPLNLEHYQTKLSIMRVRDVCSASLIIRMGCPEYLNYQGWEFMADIGGFSGVSRTKFVIVRGFGENPRIFHKIWYFRLKSD